MNRNTRRMLTAGVSILALAPLRAVAATVAGTSTVDSGVNASVSLELSNIASPPVLGIDGTTAPTTSNVFVNDIADGQVYASANTTAGSGLAENTITNVGDVVIQAIATDLGGQTAEATIEWAIQQDGSATAPGGVAQLDFTNDGSISVLANAVVNEGTAAEARQFCPMHFMLLF